jgi:hypothetical protein
LPYLYSNTLEIVRTMKGYLGRGVDVLKIRPPEIDNLYRALCIGPHNPTAMHLSVGLPCHRV